MLSRQVHDKDEGHPGLMGKIFKKVRKGLKPAGGSPNANDGKRWRRLYSLHKISPKYCRLCQSLKLKGTQVPKR